jgi:hypothetical protein
VLKDVISMMGSGRAGRSTVVVSELLDLDGPYMNVTPAGKPSPIKQKDSS